MPDFSQKIPRAHKNKIGTAPPPKPKFPPPPPKRGILWTWRFSAERRHFYFRPQNCGHKFYGHEDFSDIGLEVPDFSAVFSRNLRFRFRLRFLKKKGSVQMVYAKHVLSKQQVSLVESSLEAFEVMRASIPYEACLRSSANALSTAGNSMSSTERPFPERLLKKEASPAAVLRGR